MSSLSGLKTRRKASIFTLLEGDCRIIMDKEFWFGL
jgi:hypothetical protein